MGKREVKKEIKRIVKNFDIKDYKKSEGVAKALIALENLETIIEDYGIGLEEDFSEIGSELIIVDLEENESFMDLKNDIQILLDDIEEWKENSRESKQEEIEYEYLEPVSEIITNLDDTSWIETEDDVVTLLSDNIGSLESLLDI